MLRLVVGGCSPEDLSHVVDPANHPALAVRVDVFVGEAWPIREHLEQGIEWLRSHLRWPILAGLVVLALLSFASILIASALAHAGLAGALLLAIPLDPAVRPSDLLPNTFVLIGWIGALLLLTYLVFGPKYRLCRVYLFFLEHAQPLPILHRVIGKECVVLALRMADPNLRRRVRDFLKQDEVHLTDRHLVGPNGKISFDRQTLVSRGFDVDANSLARLAIVLMLRGGAIATAASSAREEGNVDSFLESVRSKQERSAFRLSYKINLGALKLLAAGICAIALSATALGCNLDKSLLGVFGVAWAILAIRHHRLVIRTLEKWDVAMMGKPQAFSTSPVFAYRRDAMPEEKWEELHQDDFRVRIAQFGMKGSELLNLLVAVLLVLYFTFLSLLP